MCSVIGWIKAWFMWAARVNLAIQNAWHLKLEPQSFNIFGLWIIKLTESNAVPGYWAGVGWGVGVAWGCAVQGWGCMN